MQPEKRTKTNVGVGIGLILQMLGFTFARKEDTTAILGIVLLVASVPIFVWGCMNYAEGKGHSKSFGLVGLTGLIGLIVLVLLPDRSSHGSVARSQKRKIAGLFSLITGFALLVLGLWLNHLGDDIRLEQMLGLWPGVCMVLGICLTIASLVLMLRQGDQQPREGEKS